MPFVARRPDGSIYGMWSVKQWDGQEELPPEHTEVQAFTNRSHPNDQRAADVADARAKVDEALASPAVPQPVKAALAAMKKVLG